MSLETAREVLDWYEKQPRSFTPEFLSTIDWSEVRKHPIDDRFFPVLFYMRDVEVLTDMYWQEMRRTPTGKDPMISKFMERWGVEEVFHGEIINRFINEAGIETPGRWKQQVRRAVSRYYRFNTFLITSLTNLVGRRFTATHMTFGAIHEMSTMQAYRRLEKLAAHPVLTRILNGIIREESAHTKFYSGIARIELRKNAAAQRLSRFVIENFWEPVGQGSLGKHRAKYVISTLFGEEGGLEWLDKTVTQRARAFPGFSDLTRVTDAIDQICKSAAGGIAGRSSAAIHLDAAV